MRRNEKARKSSHNRVLSYRNQTRKANLAEMKRSCNANVTPASSTSTSTSSSLNKNISSIRGNINSIIQTPKSPKTYNLKEVQNAAYPIGIEPEKAEDFYHHYNAQNWVRGNGQPITNLSSMLARWKKNQYKFEQPRAGPEANQERTKRLMKELEEENQNAIT